MHYPRYVSKARRQRLCLRSWGLASYVEAPGLEPVWRVSRLTSKL